MHELHDDLADRMPHLVGNHRDIGEAVVVQLVQVPQRPSATLARLRDAVPARKLPRRRAAARVKRVVEHMTTNASSFGRGQLIPHYLLKMFLIW